MDKKIEKSRFRPLRFLLFALVPLSILFGFKLFSYTTGIYEIAESDVIIKKVKEEIFQDIIIINGTVEPKSSVFVSIPEGGAIQKVFAEDGSMVKQGQPLFKVGNPNATLNYMTHETSIIEQINNLRNTRLSIESNRRTLKTQLIEMEFNIDKTKLQFQTDSMLFENGVAIARKDFQDTKLEYLYFKKRKATLEEVIDDENKRNEIQLKSIDTSIEMMERNLEAIRSNIENFTVKAPIDGQLSSFDPELGRNYPSGTSVGKIDVQDGYKIRALIDEFYITKVNVGQIASLQIGEHIYELTIGKILPEVANGHFEIFLKFMTKKPTDLRRGQSLSLRLALSGDIKAKLLSRGIYFQSTGGKWVYVVDDNGMAYKRDIKIGRQNNTAYEVISGLEIGEKVITSSYEFYKHHDHIKVIE